MTKKFSTTKGYQHPKVRDKRIEIQLSGSTVHALPRIAQANEAWVADQNTLEIELETVGGQRVIVALDGYAVVNLAELIGQAMKLRNTVEE